MARRYKRPSNVIREELSIHPGMTVNVKNFRKLVGKWIKRGRKEVWCLCSKHMCACKKIHNEPVPATRDCGCYVLVKKDGYNGKLPFIKKAEEVENV